MLKLPRAHEVEVELGTSEFEIVSDASHRAPSAAARRQPVAHRDFSSPRGTPRFAARPTTPSTPFSTSAPRRSSAPPRAQVASWTPPPPPAPPAARQAHAYPSSAPPMVQQAHGYASSTPPPQPTPWDAARAGYQPMFTPFVPAAPSSLTGLADHSGQHLAVAESSTRGRASGFVWAATLVLMAAFLGTMYGVQRRPNALALDPQRPATTLAAAGAQDFAPRATVLQAIAPVAPIPTVATVASPLPVVVAVAIPSAAVAVAAPAVAEPTPPASKPRATARVQAKPSQPSRPAGVLAVVVPAPKPAPVAKPTPAKASESSAEENESAQLLAKSKSVTGDSL